MPKPLSPSRPATYLPRSLISFSSSQINEPFKDLTYHTLNYSLSNTPVTLRRLLKYYKSTYHLLLIRAQNGTITSP